MSLYPRDINEWERGYAIMEASNAILASLGTFSAKRAIPSSPMLKENAFTTPQSGDNSVVRLSLSPRSPPATTWLMSFLAFSLSSLFFIVIAKRPPTDSDSETGCGVACEVPTPTTCHYSVRLLTKDELAGGFTTEIEVTTTSVNDGTVDLSKKGRSASGTGATRGEAGVTASA